MRYCGLEPIGKYTSSFIITYFYIKIKHAFFIQEPIGLKSFFYIITYFLRKIKLPRFFQVKTPS